KEVRQRLRAEGAEQDARANAALEKAQRERAEKAEADLKAKAEEQRQDLAIAQTLAADAAWANGTAEDAGDRLDRGPAHRRGFDWHWRRRAYHGGLFTLSGHTAEVLAVCFSADGTRLATASRDQTARLWDARTGQELLALQGHTGMVVSVCFSPDGTRLATGSMDRTARLWDARSGRELLALPGHTAGVWSVAFSTAGKRLAAARHANDRQSH